MAQYSYQIFIPGGNKTALVLGVDGLEDDYHLRKNIQDKILAKHEHDLDGEVEQVGFISVDQSSQYRLIMTGDEFCGNATRSAAAYYLRNSGRGNIEIKVSGTQKSIQAGFENNLSHNIAWAEMPLIENFTSSVRELKNRLFLVTIEGISHLIIPQVQSTVYLEKIFSCETNEAKIDIAFNYLKKIQLDNSLSLSKAYGIIFLENVVDTLRMHPFVHVEKANTTYYETACGSGAICIGLLSHKLTGSIVRMPLLQPSGKIIKAEIEISDNGEIDKGRISGEIEIGEVYEVEC